MLNIFSIQKVFTLVSSGCCDALRHRRPSTYHTPNILLSPTEIIRLCTCWSCYCPSGQFTITKMTFWAIPVWGHCGRHSGVFPKRKHKKFYRDKFNKPLLEWFQTAQTDLYASVLHSHFKNIALKVQRTVECYSYNASEKKKKSQTLRVVMAVT